MVVDHAKWEHIGESHSQNPIHKLPWTPHWPGPSPCFSQAWPAAAPSFPLRPSPGAWRSCASSQQGSSAGPRSPRCARGVQRWRVGIYCDLRHLSSSLEGETKDLSYENQTFASSGKGWPVVFFLDFFAITPGNLIQLWGCKPFL